MNAPPPSFKRQGILTVLSLLVLLLSSAAQAQNIPPGQDVGARERVGEETRKQQERKKKLFEGKKKTLVEEKELPKPPAAEGAVPETKVLISKIEVEGATLLDEKTIRSVVSPYEGKALGLQDFKAIADEITQHYRDRGYATSFALIPPQKIEAGTLRIRVAEGRVGEMDLIGNRFFLTSLLKRYIGMKPGDPFNYDLLRRGMDRLNEHPDRTARVVLERGEGPNETDVHVNVKDDSPWHVSAGYNNYNSHLLDRNKGSLELKNANFLGRDDILSGEVQLGEAGHYQLYAVRYLFPFGFQNQDRLGFNYIHIEQRLGGTVGGLDIEGKGDILSPHYSHPLINEENLDLSFVGSFDYKQIENKLRGTIVGKDDLRILKAGFDLDATDPWRGRTIATHEFHFGLPGFLGGLEDNDPSGSRAGAGTGGNFFRTVTNFARIQSLPRLLSAMLKGSVQLSADDLVSAEQFTIGGFYTTRGYPVGEFAGDQGFSLSSELYVPPYFIPSSWKVPFTKKTSLFDSLRFMGFVDWGYIHNRKTLANEPQTRNLVGVGPAVRFYIPNRLSISFDYGIAVGREPSTGSRTQGYIEVKAYF